ncbi:MAG TPA: hypothetical protein VLB27_04855, partial [candidate division Zixibacteria bacterium]|nr:hypothetical protein [candidate division Zixibacteria bacterium]
MKKRVNQTSVRKSRSSAAQRHPIGAHMSIAGGVFNALVDGAAVGCTAIQVFTKSNQQWKARPLKAEEVERFFELRKETGI